MTTDDIHKPRARAQLQHSKLGKRPASSHHVKVQAGNSQGLRQLMGTA